jgi:hypothetical protein
MIYLESLVRPTLYLSFKASGQGATFEEDMAIKLDYGGGENPPMLSEIMAAVRRINKINLKPMGFWLRTIAIHAFFIWAGHAIMASSLLEENVGIFLGTFATGYMYYFYMIYPFIIQSFRRTQPLIIFDDVNKIANMGLLAQISRYLELLDQDMANIVLVSSDEETWFKLRKEPGLRDRLRQKVITYDHQFTGEQLINYLADEGNYRDFLRKTRVSSLFTKEIIMLLIQELIINRQVTLRRLTGVLGLNDEEEYDEFVKVLKEYHEKKITTKEAVAKLTESTCS